LLPAKGEETILTHASTRGNSLRTTVPIGVVRQLGLKEGDRLRWEIQADNNNLIILVKPVKEENK
jgi:antitoxin component of MazEF toxin-antitoxin module